MPYKDPEKERTNHRERDRRWRQRHPEYNKKDYWRNPEKHREWVRRYRQRLKMEVLSHYGNGIPQCACCGEKTLQFLTIDHINGGGRREKVSDTRLRAGSPMYARLKRLGYPPGFQVLCFNCNCAKGFYGVCPHKQGEASGP
jgi:hypothetical protein